MILDIYIGYTYIYIYAVIEPVNIESQDAQRLIFVEKQLKVFSDLQIHQ